MPKAYIVGLGKSGIASAKLLKSDGWDVVISDRSTSPSLLTLQQELEATGIKVNLGDDISLADPTDLIVVSPGVPWDIPVLQQARDKGIDTIGEVELAWRYLKSYPWVAITGTNGKTTTTALVEAMFKAAGFKAPACGNIGYAVCELAKDAFTQEFIPDWVIAEISSYQIESSLDLAPKIAIWTTFTPDHLSRHKTLENYYQIKASLLRRAKKQVLNGDDPYLRNMGVKEWGDAYWTSVNGKKALLGDRTKGVYIEDGWVSAFGEVILPVNLFKMVGVHNRQNLLMAVAAAKLADIDSEAIAKAIAAFKGVPHRLEYVSSINGVRYINDSKATNYDAAEVGLNAVDAPVVLIAGGEAKQGDDTGWLNQIKKKAAAVLLIGEAGEAFSKRLEEVGYQDYQIVETMENAVKTAVNLAPAKGAKVVLLSPACASFDQYQNFEQRGDDFRKWCLQMGK